MFLGFFCLTAAVLLYFTQYTVTNFLGSTYVPRWFIFVKIVGILLLLPYGLTTVINSL